MSAVRQGSSRRLNESMRVGGPRRCNFGESIQSSLQPDRRPHAILAQFCPRNSSNTGHENKRPIFADSASARATHTFSVVTQIW